MLEHSEPMMILEANVKYTRQFHPTAFPNNLKQTIDACTSSVRSKHLMQKSLQAELTKFSHSQINTEAKHRAM
jgi:hypothetical protein